jgi:hypothetical protein
MTTCDRPVSEIEITEEMVEAGVAVLRRAYAPAGEPQAAMRRAVREILEAAFPASGPLVDES